jgi:hypothetical protein
MFLNTICMKRANDIFRINTRVSFGGVFNPLNP